MYRTRYISLGLVDRDVTVTLVTVTVDPGPQKLDPAGPAVGIKGGGVNIKLVGIKFHPRLRGVVPGVATSIVDASKLSSPCST